MEDKRGNTLITIPAIGLLIIAVALILLFREAMGGFSVIVAAVIALCILSFFGWFIIDLTV